MYTVPWVRNLSRGCSRQSGTSPRLSAQASVPAAFSSAATAYTALPTTTIMAAPAPSNADAVSKLVVHHLNDSRSQRILWLLVSTVLPDHSRLFTGWR